MRKKEQIGVAKKALHVIAMESEDIIYPLRAIPRERMVQIASKAIHEISRLEKTPFWDWVLKPFWYQ